MKASILDSYAVLAFLFKEPGHKTVISLLEQAAALDDALLIVAPNWTEIRYIVERKFGAARWRDTRTKLLGLPIEIVPVDQELAEMAGEIKAVRKMSLADCFAAALAKKNKMDVCTGDPEFKAVENEIGIFWL